MGPGWGGSFRSSLQIESTQAVWKQLLQSALAWLCRRLISHNNSKNYKLALILHSLSYPRRS